MKTSKKLCLLVCTLALCSCGFVSRAFRDDSQARLSALYGEYYQATTRYAESLDADQSDLTVRATAQHLIEADRGYLADLNRVLHRALRVEVSREHEKSKSLLIRLLEEEKRITRTSMKLIGEAQSRSDVVHALRSSNEQQLRLREQIMLPFLDRVRGYPCQEARRALARLNTRPPVDHASDVRVARPAPEETPTVEEARKALEAEPDRPLVQFRMGLSLYDDGLYAPAESYLRMSSLGLKEPIERHWAGYYLAMSVEGQGRLAEAASLYEALVASAPDDSMRSRHYFEAGFAHERIFRGREDTADYKHANRALHFYERSLQYDRTFSRAAVRLASLHEFFGRSSEAERYYRLALEHATTDRDRSRSLFGLGMLAEEAGENAEAVKMYEQALAKNPGHERTLRRLERVRQALGSQATTKRP